MHRPYPVVAGPSIVAGAALLGLLLGGCGADLLLPDDPDHPSQRITVTPAAGDGQRGTVAAPLPEPVAVRVATLEGQPAPGVRVVFRATNGTSQGDVDPDTALSDANGSATARWVLGPLAGPQTLRAEVVEVAAENAVVSFSAVAEAGAPDVLGRVSGNNQRGEPGRTLPAPLVVLVADRYGNPVPGATVVWEVTGGFGRVSPSEVATDSAGLAATQWTLGLFGGQRVTATVLGGSGASVLFQAERD
jgi:hypothetical protein